MSTQDDKADTPLPQTKITTNQQTAITERLSKLEDKLHNLLACYQFYNHAIRAITDPTQLEDSQEWYFGLFLNQQWLTKQGEQLMTELVDCKALLKT